MHEADYWRLVLEDLLAVNDLTVEASQPLTGIAVRTLEIVAGSDPLEVGARINDDVTASLDAIVRMHEPIERMVELVKGRETAMRRELEGEPDDC